MFILQANAKFALAQAKVDKAAEAFDAVKTMVSARLAKAQNNLNAAQAAIIAALKAAQAKLAEKRVALINVRRRGRQRLYVVPSMLSTARHCFHLVMLTVFLLLQAQAAFKQAKTNADNAINAAQTKVNGLISSINTADATCNKCFLHLCGA